MYDAALDIETEACGRCGGPGTFLGQLGRFLWYRCRGCGIDFHREEA